MTALWLGSCYVVFAISVVLAKQMAEPVLLPPVPFFPISKVVAAAELNSDPIPSCEIFSVPVALDTAADKPTEFELSIDGDLPNGVKLLNPTAPVFFSAGSDQSSIRLMVNWRVVRQLVTIPLRLSTGSKELPSDKNVCDLQLYPLPAITSSVDKAVFDEGKDGQISVNYDLAFGFPKALKLKVKLVCDEEIEKCIPIREKTVEFEPFQTLAKAVFEVPDNELATGDREISVSAASEYTRVSVSGKRPKLTYNDDEQVYNVELITTGVPKLDEEEIDPKPVLLKARLSEPCGPKGIQIPLLIQGTAQQGIDYTITDIAFKFSQGQSEAVLELKVVNDNLRDENENISISILPNKFLRLKGASISSFTIQDNDPFLVYAKLTTIPAKLREGNSLSTCTVNFAVAPGQSSIKSLIQPPRSFSVFFEKTGENPKSSNFIEVIEPDGKALSNPTLDLDTKGRATIQLRAKDDLVPNGFQLGKLRFKASSDIDVKPFAEMVVEIEDNDPLAATLTIEGESRSINGGKSEVTLDEGDTQLGVFLRLTLAEPAERDLEAGLVSSGKADSQDYVLGPSPYLKNDAVGKAEYQLSIPKGTKTFSIPIFAKDDDAFEGAEYLIFDLVPTVGDGKAKVMIEDNDSFILGFDKNPLVIKEGEKSAIRVCLKNAQSGITRETPFTLSLEGGDASSKQLKLLSKKGVIPANKSFIEIPIEAVSDNLAEGRQTFTIKLEIDQNYRDHSKVESSLDVWVDDVGFEATHAVVLVVTPKLKKEWNSIRQELAKLISTQGPQLAGGGIVMVGAEPEPAIWKVTSTQLPVQPIIYEPGDETFKKVVRAIDAQLSKEFRSADATVVWDVTDAPHNLPSEKLSFPESDRLKISLLLYGADASSTEVTRFKSIATERSNATRQHRIVMKNDISKVPASLEAILQSSLKQ